MKKKISKFVPYLVILALVFIILHLKGCFGPPKKDEVIKINGKDYQVVRREIDPLYNTKTQVVYKKGKDITHEIEVIKEIPANVDTMSILKDYYSRVFYKDTFKLKDSLGYFVINDTISKNKIAKRKVESFVRIPTIKETLYLKELSNDFYAGPALQAGNPTSLGADFHLKTKKDILFGLGLGVNTNISPYIRGSVSWKINK